MGNISKQAQKNREQVIKRLHYALGHLKAVGNMIEKNASCFDIINQNSAVIEALKKINQMILEGHLGICAWDAVNSKNSAKRKKALSELVSLYQKSN